LLNLLPLKFFGDQTDFSLGLIPTLAVSIGLCLCNACLVAYFSPGACFFYTRALFFLLSLTLFICKGEPPCSLICMFKMRNTDNHYSPCLAMSQPVLAPFAASSFICNILLPYSFTFILVTLLDWFNLCLHIFRLFTLCIMI
jgi:hypothetical protein